MSSAQAPARGGVTAQTTRYQWVDVAKGVAILLVVVHHVVQWEKVAGWMPDVVVLANQQLSTFRMPLFFTAAGLFAHRSVTGPWSALWRKRVALLVWLYLLWATVSFVLLNAAPFEISPESPGGFRGWVGTLVVPYAGLWFIYALALYSLAARLTKGLPVSVQLLAAGAVCVTAQAFLVDFGSYAWRVIAAYYFFFLLGVYAAPLAHRLAAAATLPRAGASAAAYAVLSAVVWVLDAEHVPGVGPVLGLCAVATGIQLAAASAGSRLGLHLAWIGQRTLQIYLLHVFVIAAVVNAAVVWGVQPDAGLAAVLVLPLTGVAVALSLALHRGLDRLGGSVLFRLPAGGRGAAQRP